MIFAKVPIIPPQDSGESLTASNWTARGLGAANLVLGNNSLGELTITCSAAVDRSWVSLATPFAVNNGTVRLVMMIDGTDLTTAQNIAGPGMRLSGTNGTNNMNAYLGCVIREGAASGDPWRWRLRQINAGVNTGAGTGASGNIVGGLQDKYSVMDLTVRNSGTVANVSLECSVEGQPVSYTDAYSDTAPLTGTDWGIAISSMKTTHTLRIKYIGLI